MTVQLALRKNDTRLAARGIRWWTDSIYSHCELVVDGVCYSSSAMDKGVRAKVIDLDPAKWDLIDVPWVDGREVVDYFLATDHHTYGWAGLAASQLFNRNQPGDGAQFCSQWCAAAMGLPSPASYSPRTLMELSLYVSLAVLACSAGGGSSPAHALKYQHSL